MKKTFEVFTLNQLKGGAKEKAEWILCREDPLCPEPALYELAIQTKRLFFKDGRPVYEKVF
jgi:hypothetical protein